MNTLLHSCRSLQITLSWRTLSAAHLDGCASLGKGDHATNWEAGGNSGAVAKRACDCREIFRALATAVRERTRGVRKQILERTRWLPRRRHRLRSSTGRCRSYISTEPNLRYWRIAAHVALERKGASCCRFGREAFAHAGRFALARPG